MAVRFKQFDGSRVSRAWWEVLTAARRDGVDFRVNSGKRTLAEQTALFRQNMIRPGVPKPGRPLTAFPSPFAPHIRTGRIDHAIDVRDENLFALGGGAERLMAWGKANGVAIARTVRTEAWHLEAPADQLRAFARARRRRRRQIGKARAGGAHFATAIFDEAKRTGLGYALGLALIEQETGFRNVFGHDPTIFSGAGEVTRDKYFAYKAKRGARGTGGMQGVGPAQLTWWEYQDRADLRGGCWQPEHNIAVGFDVLAAAVKTHGERKGLAVYNGGSRNPNFAYADQVLARKRKWVGRLS